jgi:hypothetical protein
MTRVAVITIGIDPEIHLAPLTLAWHGVTIALAILIGGLANRGPTRARAPSVLLAADSVPRAMAHLPWSD